MSENDPQTPEVTQQTEELGENGKKALAAERSRANAAEKAMKELRGQLDAIEASKLSDLERLQKENAALASERDTANAAALRLSIANDHGISKEDAAVFLTGADEDTLKAQAKRLAELSKVETPEVTTAPGPFVRPDNSQGPKQQPTTSPAQQFASFLTGAMGRGPTL